MKLENREQLFKNPGIEFRGKPFWSWNEKLQKEELIKQINVMKEMGFGGYFMHSRTGLETEYLGDEWFDLINECADYGTHQGMESWLYDEDRWPSGSAGGIVTKEEKYRAMFIEMNVMTPEAYASFHRSDKTISVYALTLNDGVFSSKRLLKDQDYLLNGETAVEFFIRYSECKDNYNGYCYLNTMSVEAVEAFIESTHEKYKQKCKNRLGGEIKGIFTDEPHRGGVFTSFAEGKVNAAPYTPDLFEEFEKRFHYDLKDLLCELFLRKEASELSKVTRDYFELCQELFIERFAIPVYEWCQKNNLIFTGHVLHEDTLSCQAVMQGSLMRFYEYMSYPGVDVLGEYNKNYWIAKQVASVARQLNKEWVLSELYGCTGWQMNFASYKNVGDWQALLGVNLRCPHLSWYTMKGEAKRDFPASILHQSYWYRDFSYVEDYFSRIAAALHDGTPECNLLVINPIESIWARAYSGAFRGLMAEDPQMKRIEKTYQDTFHILMKHQIDFDYGEEDLLSRYASVQDGVLTVGQSKYRKVLVAGVDTLRRSTLKLLKEFVNDGGTVVFAGTIPAFVDAERSMEVQTFSAQCICVPFKEEEIAKACANGDELKIVSEGSDDLLSQTYQVDGGRMVMILNTNRESGYQNVSLTFQGGDSLLLWNPRNGQVKGVPYEKTPDGISLTISLEAGGERIYLVREQKEDVVTAPVIKKKTAISLPDALDYQLTEDNICVLDYVTLSDANGNKVLKSEVLKADRSLRTIYHMPYRGGDMLQPWYQVKHKIGTTEPISVVTAQYEFEIETVPEKLDLVVEDIENIKSIEINGVNIDVNSSGKWIDICFSKIPILKSYLTAGVNQIAITMDYYATSGIEAIYLTGAFGVSLGNHQCVLTKLPQKLMIGDVTEQGLPFYSGSIKYLVHDLENKSLVVTASQFGGALIKLHGASTEYLAFPPYRAECFGLKEIEVVLTRRNTFGPLHQLPKKMWSYGPNSFVSTGEHFSEAYVLYPQGILEKPVLEAYEQ